jgi:hypothetical protein
MSLIPLQLFMEALEQSEVVFITDHYLTPTAVRIQESLLNYFLSLNG